MGARAMLIAKLAGAVLLAACGQFAAAEAPPVLVRAQIAQGVLEGESLGEVLAFRGIPYAAPPLRELRFRPPQPPLPWSGVRSALDMGPACPQLIDSDPTENNDSVMAEDCLSLNIWTPKTDVSKRPVLFWIHGGAFVVGSSRNTFYDGSHLAARGNAVVVSINYRLGAWGFLDLSPFGAPYAESANVGLLDQVAALNWVKQNIAKFGGDPDNVTIFGESAGAASVGDLLSMPAAKGLFSRAILESGLPSDRKAKASHRQNDVSREFLKLAGVHSPAQLATKSMKDLLNAQERLFATKSDIGTFVPSVDGAVLTEKPFTVVAQGRGSRVPIMLGTTLEEMRYFATAEDLGIEQKPRQLLLSQLKATVGSRAQEVLDEYQRLYPMWGDTVVQIASDAIMRFPAIRLAEAVSAHQPVYMYLFTYRSNSTYEHFGSAHAMDLPFVFGTVNFPEVIVFTGRDPRRYELADKVMDSWIVFARSGNPTLPSGPQWPAYDPVKRSTMELGPEIRVVEDPLSEQRKVWGATLPTVEHAWPLLLVNK
jgi:para-nitrobenzyl esterase